MAVTKPAWLEELERNDCVRTLRTIVHTAGKNWEKLAVVDFPRRRVICGLACSGEIVHGEAAFEPMGCELSLPPIRFAHEDGHRKLAALMARDHRIGETISLMKTPLGIYVEAAIDETPAGDFAWNLMRRGKAKGLSGGFCKIEIGALVKNIQFVRKWSLNEISVCENGGADPAAKFQIVHDIGGVVWP